MKLHHPDGKILKVNHPKLPAPQPTPPMPHPKLMLEKRTKKKS
jgi:hypothetical protein